MKDSFDFRPTTKETRHAGKSKISLRPQSLFLVPIYKSQAEIRGTQNKKKQAIICDRWGELKGNAYLFLAALEQMGEEGWGGGGGGGGRGGGGGGGTTCCRDWVGHRGVKCIQYS